MCETDLDTLQSLVDKSLVRVREGGRFWMLETVRELAEERLAASGEGEVLSRRHFEYFLSLARDASLAVDSEPRRQDVDPGDREGPNLKVAIDRAAARGDVAAALSILVELEQHWATREPFEAVRRVRELLGRDGLPARLHARSLRVLGGSLQMVGDVDGAADAYAKSLELFRAVGDDENAALLLVWLGSVASLRGRFDEARGLIAEARNTLPPGRAPRVDAFYAGWLGHVEEMSGKLDRAVDLYLTASRKGGEAAFPWWEAVMVAFAANAAERLGDLSEATRLAREAAPRIHAVGDRQNTVSTLAQLARLARSSGNDGKAAVIWGAIEAEERRGPMGGWDRERHLLAGDVEGLPAAELARGRVLSLREAVAFAVSLD